MAAFAGVGWGLLCWLIIEVGMERWRASRVVRALVTGTLVGITLLLTHVFPDSGLFFWPWAAALLVASGVWRLVRRRRPAE